MNRVRRALSILLVLILASVATLFAACDRVTEYDGLNTTTSSAQSIVHKTKGVYYAHPDSAMMADGRILTVYVEGHGKGALHMRSSRDGGMTWSEDLDTPLSWANSEETPTIYRLQLSDGSEKVVLISGRPGWDRGRGGGGWNTSVSTDDGMTWSEFETTFWQDLYRSDADISAAIRRGDVAGQANPNAAIVAMASLTRIKENGEYVDKWMALYHDYAFNNYKTYLTFDEDGRAVWSKPERLFPEEYREVEYSRNFCEIECVRSPDESELMLLIRTNAHRSGSYVTTSTDEGETWSTPRELPDFLTGDRHKAEYDPTTGKLIVSFRELVERSGGKRKANDWCGWCGDYAVIRSYADEDPSNDIRGGVRILFAREYGPKGDCGYSGVVPLGDGRVLLTSYGRFNSGAVNPYILSVIYEVPQ